MHVFQISPKYSVYWESSILCMHACMHASVYVSMLVCIMWYNYVLQLTTFHEWYHLTSTTLSHYCRQGSRDPVYASGMRDSNVSLLNQSWHFVPTWITPENLFCWKIERNISNQRGDILYPLGFHFPRRTWSLSFYYQCLCYPQEFIMTVALDPCELNTQQIQLIGWVPHVQLRLAGSAKMFHLTMCSHKSWTYSDNTWDKRWKQIVKSELKG